MRPQRMCLLAALLACTVALAAAVACNDGSSGESNELVVIDQNILHGIIDEDPDADPYDRFPERIQLFADAVGEEKPDVLFMQEVVGNPAEDYPNTRSIILAALGSDYTAVFGNFLGDPIDSDGLGQMTFTRLPVLSSENKPVSAIRSVQHVALQGEDGTIDVYNAHLEGTGAVLETGEDAAVTEMQNVIDFIDETRSGTGPVILAGDLNAQPNDPSIQHLLQAGFVDVIAAAGDPTCAKAGDPGCTNSTIPLGDNPDDNADHRIDYIFVLGGSDLTVEPGEAKLYLNEPVDIGDGHTLWASDHIGVWTRLNLQRD